MHLDNFWRNTIGRGSIPVVCLPHLRSTCNHIRVALFLPQTMTITHIAIRAYATTTSKAGRLNYLSRAISILGHPPAPTFVGTSVGRIKDSIYEPPSIVDLTPYWEMIIMSTIGCAVPVVDHNLTSMLVSVRSERRHTNHYRAKVDHWPRP